MWIWILVGIIAVAVIIGIVVILSSGSPKYKPVWTATISSIPENNLDDTLYYPIYFQLQNLNQLKNIEADVYNSGEVMSPLQIKQLFATDITNAISYLETFGTVVWVSESNTYGIFQTTPRQLLSIVPQLKVITASNSYIGTYNNPYKFKYGIVLDYFNFSGEENLTNYTPEEWTQNYGILNQPIGNPQGMYFGIQQEGAFIQNQIGTPSPDRAVGIMTSELPSKTALETLAVQMGYNQDKFTSNWALVYMDPTQDPPLQESVPLYDADDEVNEITLDMCSCFSVRPDSPVVVYFMNAASVNAFSLLPLWSSLELTQYDMPNIWTSSFGLSSEIDSYDYERVSNEYLLVGLGGINTFQASGDQGIYSQLYNSGDVFSEKADITKPDTIKGIFNSPYTVTVGGFTRTQDPEYANSFTENISLTIPQVESEPTTDPGGYYSNFFFASGGGFARGIYNDPQWKKNNSQEYINNNSYTSVNQKITPTGEFSNFSVEIDKQGAIKPDIIYIGNVTIPYQNNYVFLSGTSVSAPFTASIFALLNDLRAENNKQNLPLIIRHLHENPQFFQRVLQGKNNMYNLIGYSVNQNCKWDPVQGLGIPDLEQWRQYSIDF